MPEASSETPEATVDEIYIDLKGNLTHVDDDQSEQS
jgi:hypothetical protein